MDDTWCVCACVASWPAQIECPTTHTNKKKRKADIYFLIAINFKSTRCPPLCVSVVNRRYKGKRTRIKTRGAGKIRNVWASCYQHSWFALYAETRGNQTKIPTLTSFIAYQQMWQTKISKHLSNLVFVCFVCFVENFATKLYGCNIRWRSFLSLCAQLSGAILSWEEFPVPDIGSSSTTSETTTFSFRQNCNRVCANNILENALYICLFSSSQLGSQKRSEKKKNFL